MDSETKKRFYSLLEAERQRIVQNSKKLREQLSEQSTVTGDEADEAQTLLQTDLSLRFRDRERQLLDKIEKALEKIKDGTFGECQECDEEIEPKRLEARPTATLCLGCKEAEEKREKEYA